jgi:uncharacterized protein YceK
MRAVVLALTVAVLGGCGTVSDFYRIDDYEKTARAYGRLIRWSDFEKAVVFLKLDASTSLPDLERLKQFQVTGYEALDARFSENKRTVTQIVKIEYLVRSRMVERALTDQQVWEYSETHERWVLASGFPAFK